MTSRRLRPLALLLLVAGALAFFGSRDPPAPIEPLRTPSRRVARSPTPPGAPAEPAVPTPGPTLGAAEAGGPAPGGPVRVRVLGPGDLPLPGVFVAARVLPHRDLDGGAVATDERGEATLPDVRYDGTRLLHVYARDPDRGGHTRVWERLDAWGRRDNVQPILGPEVVYRAATGLELTVHAVNAATGDALEGLRLRAEEGRRASDRAWAPPPGRFLLTPRVGQPTSFVWDLEPPPGFVAWERPWLTAAISPYARELVAYTPLRHEIPVTLLPREADGGPARVEILSLEVAGRAPDWSFRGDGAGRLHVAGVPFLPEEILDVRLCRPDRTGPARVWGVVPEHPGAGLDLEVRMPTDGRVDEGPPAGGIAMGRTSTSVRTRQPQAALPGAVHVRVRRHGGEPAVGATVTLGSREERTDGAGVAQFDGVLPGPRSVSVRQVGLLPLARVVEVAAQGTTRVELQEGAGAQLEVLVTDGAQRPLSFATLEITLPSGQPWVDLRDGRQRIDPYTDQWGRRELGGLEAGDVQVTATWGSRRATQTVALEAGGTRQVTFVLERPVAPVR